ncbi:MAG: DUF45 domain-containing protein [Gammaproteobacteria bacterium]|nr:DUF45 domain-containing protein [Gammaproteobacteria bacterium]
MVWPPQYKIKRHRRAKHVKLRANHHELEITLPLRFNLKNVPSILEENKSWIIEQLSKLSLTESNVFPDSIKFNATNESWKIHYVACHAKFEMIVRPHYEIVLVGNRIHDSSSCSAKLNVWIKKQSKHYLHSQLVLLSKSTQLDFESLTVRGQKTLWGSCTAKKSISLNYKLIFLPYHLVRHVMIHELCHTRFLNHSNKFWELVAVHDPDWREHRYELRSANQYIPEWIANF